MVGINFDDDNLGFKQIVLKPNFIKAMDFAQANYNSIYVEIKAEWKKTSKGVYKYLGVIPVNCEAKVVLPNKTINLTDTVSKLSSYENVFI